MTDEMTWDFTNPAESPSDAWRHQVQRTSPA